VIGFHGARRSEGLEGWVGQDCRRISSSQRTRWTVPDSVYVQRKRRIEKVGDRLFEGEEAVLQVMG
jgi:hypothetical protein